MRHTQVSTHQIDRVRNDWVQAVAYLEEQIAEWAQSEGWQVSFEEKEMNEEFIGSYKVPDLFIETPEGEQLVLEVQGRGAIEGSGRVQLMAWPTLFRVHLLYKGSNDWVIRTDSGIPLRQPWNRETFLTLAKDLLGAE